MIRGVLVVFCKGEGRNSTESGSFTGREEERTYLAGSGKGFIDRGQFRTLKSSLSILKIQADRVMKCPGKIK